MTLDLDKIVKDLEKKGFTEISGGSNLEAENWDFEKNPVFEGVFVSKKEGLGANNSNLYFFQDKTSKAYSVWGSVVLDTRLKNIQVGEVVSIIFIGRKPSKVAGRKPYKDFRVFHEGLNDSNIPLPKESDR